MRLGRLWAGFWKPQNSILEPPGLDFGASNLDFEASRLDCGASRPPTFLCVCFPHSATPLGKRGTIFVPMEPPGCQPFFAYASHIQQHHLANVGQSLAWGSFLLCFCLPQQPCQSVGGGGVPPWGPSIRRPPKVCEACWTINQSSSAKCQTQSQMANLKGQAFDASPGS